MVWWSSWGPVQGSKNGMIGHQNWPMADIEAYWGMVLFNPIEGWQVLPTLLCHPSESSSSCWDPPAQYRATMPTSHCHGHRHQWIHFQHQYMGWHNALCCAGRLNCLIQKTNRTSLALRSLLCWKFELGTSPTLNKAKVSVLETLSSGRIQIFLSLWNMFDINCKANFCLNAFFEDVTQQELT